MYIYTKCVTQGQISLRYQNIGNCHHGHSHGCVGSSVLYYSFVMGKVTAETRTCTCTFETSEKKKRRNQVLAARKRKYLKITLHYLRPPIHPEHYSLQVSTFERRGNLKQC